MNYPRELEEQDEERIHENIRKRKEAEKTFAYMKKIQRKNQKV